MRRSDLKGKYWHELTNTEKKCLRDSRVSLHWLVDNILQPEWCDYPKELVCQMGCWTLMRDNKRISKESCGSGSCGYYMRGTRVRKESQ